MSNKERVLIVAPHCDDESFGCLGTLLHHLDKSSTFAFLWFTQARNTVVAVDAITQYFNAKSAVFLNYRDQLLDTYPLIDLMKPIEQMRDKFKPTIAYIPFIGDLNRDHRLVSEASMVALRPYKKDVPKQVWMYKINGTTELGFREFRCDRLEEINGNEKTRLIKSWYPNELINDREYISDHEEFEKWPR